MANLNLGQDLANTIGRNTHAFPHKVAKSYPLSRYGSLFNLSDSSRYSLSHDKQVCQES